MKKTLTIILIIVLVLAVAAAGYWYFFMRPILETPASPNVQTPTPGNNPPGFSPFDRPGNTGGTGASGTSTTTTNPDGTPVTPGTPVARLPVLRLLSSAPVGGYGASTTNATTTVRWVDRGRGNVYETNYFTSYVTTLSNTIVPRTYESVWNKNLNAFVATLYQDGEDAPSTVYAQLVPIKVSTTSDTSQTPYELKGKNLPDNVLTYAVSPDKAKLFLLIEESGNGVGYVSTFDGLNMTRIFTTPLTEVNVDWPVADKIAITTKGSASSGGFLYFVSPITGTWTKILGPIGGLSTTVSHDAKYVLFSSAAIGNTMSTKIYNVAKATTIDAVVRTLADKCAWGNFYKETVYCAVPSQPASGRYPDDWYAGKISAADKIWQIDSATGNVRQLSALIDQSDRVIDAFNLGLDNKDEYLFFINKNDLSLWSLDLVRTP